MESSRPRDDSQERPVPAEPHDQAEAFPTPKNEIDKFDALAMDTADELAADAETAAEGQEVVDADSLDRMVEASRETTDDGVPDGEPVEAPRAEVFFHEEDHPLALHAREAMAGIIDKLSPEAGALAPQPQAPFDKSQIAPILAKSPAENLSALPPEIRSFIESRRTWIDRINEPRTPGPAEELPDRPPFMPLPGRRNDDPSHVQKLPMIIGETEDAPPVLFASTGEAESIRQNTDADPFEPRSISLLAPTSDEGPPLARPILLVNLPDERTAQIVEDALNARAEWDARLITGIAEERVSYALWARDCEDRATMWDV